jgi:hypothetical protein
MLRGLVKGGANSSTIFTLPSGFHPSGEQRFIAGNAAGANFVDVDTAGNVVFSGFANNNSWQSLDGITFYADGT